MKKVLSICFIFAAFSSSLYGAEISFKGAIDGSGAPSLASNLNALTLTAGSEKVANGTFATTTGWTPVTEDTLASVAGGQSGNCLQITVAGGSADWVYTTVTTVAGRYYTFQGYHKNGTSTGRISVYDTAIAGTLLFNTNTVSDASWQFFDGVFQAASSTTVLAVRVMTDGNGDTTLYDSISVKEVSATADVIALSGVSMAGVPIISKTYISLAANADTTIYTVPTGKTFVPLYALLVAGADAGATSTISIGQDTAETDFIPANTLSNLDAAGDAVILMPVPNTTPTKIKSYAAGTVIQAQVALQSGGTMNVIYLYGLLY